MGDTTDRPTIHLTNWSSRRHHGPGRKFTIMAAPRKWEHGDGRVPTLIPLFSDLSDYQDDRIGIHTYQRRYEGRLQAAATMDVLSPGALSWLSPLGHDSGLVSDGDTLCCACSRADAAAGKCHRAWAAPFLVRAGWRVILDGVEVTLD